MLRHAATGVGNRELAGRLSISEATVKVHLTRIFQKLGVPGRAALAAVYHAIADAEGARRERGRATNVVHRSVAAGRRITAIAEDPATRQPG